MSNVAYLLWVIVFVVIIKHDRSMRIMKYNLISMTYHFHDAKVLTYKQTSNISNVLY